MLIPPIFNNMIFVTHRSARGPEEVLILEEPRLSLPLQSGRLRLLLPLPGGGVPVVLVTGHWVTRGRGETPGGAWCPAHPV